MFISKWHRAFSFQEGSAIFLAQLIAMYVKRNYGFWMTFLWSHKPFLFGSLYAAAACGLHEFTPLNASLPWQPISILGIAVAFYLGFKNNVSYERTWEARKIWGAIVNYSRTFATGVLTFMDGNEEAKRRLIHRHIAWLTALRYQLRLVRAWEHTDERVHGMYIPTICESYFDRLTPELLKLVSKDELDQITTKSNIASQLLLNQSKDIAELYKDEQLTDYRQVRLHELIGLLFDEQGKSERIKNFPFPRQYASTALWLTLVFSALMPFGMLSTFSEGGEYIWLTIPFSGLLIWVFFLMEKIGDYSENPFEGTYNDVPITSISRTIEIDLREMLGETNIPPPVPEENGFLM